MGDLTIASLENTICHIMYACIHTKWASLVAQLVKNPPSNAGDPGSIPGVERSPGG